MKNTFLTIALFSACAASAQCNIVGMQMFEVHKGTNVLTGVLFGSPDGRFLSQPLKRQFFEYKTGDTFIWTLDGKTCSYRFDGAHWHDADGKDADDVVLPSLKTEITFVREADVTSRVSIAGQLNAADQKKIDDEIANRTYPCRGNGKQLKRAVTKPVPVANRPDLPPPGYVEVEIKKGKTVIDPPFLDPCRIGRTMETVGKQRWDVKKGDSISWRPGNYEVKCTFDGEKWNCPCDQIQKDLVIPLGKYPLTFERTVDETSTFSVHGWIDMRKAPKK